MSTSIVALVYALIGWAIGAGLLMTFFKEAVSEEVRKPLIRYGIFLTFVMFLVPSAPLFLGISIVVLLMARQKVEPLAAAVFLSVVVVGGSWPIPFPGVNYLYALSFQELVALFVLVPVILLDKKKKLPGMGFIDFCVTIVLLAYFWRAVNSPSITSSLRSMVEQILTIWVPYTAFSRGLVNRQQIIALAEAAFCALMVLSGITIVSSLIYWNVYDWANGSLFNRVAFVKSRGALLRVSATFGGGYINLGGFLVFCLLSSWALLQRISSRLFRFAPVFVALLAVLLATARGPFVAFVFGTFVFVLTRPNSFAVAFRLLIIGTVAFFALAIFPPTSGILEYVPFLGSGENTASYRRELLEVGWQLVLESPLTGDLDFLLRPEMEALRQGEGIIDLVNTYLTIAMLFGLPVAILYMLAFSLPVIGLIQSAQSIDQEADGLWRGIVGGLAAGMASLFLLYASVSVAAQMDALRWALLGASVACIRIVRDEKKQKADAEVSIPVYA